MSIRRAAAVLTGAAALLLAGLGAARAQDPDTGLRVRTVRTGAAEAKPLTTVTLVFLVVNGTDRAHEVAPRLELPEGWTAVIDETPYRLGAGERSVRLISVAVPGRAPMGTYRIGYAYEAADDATLAGRAEAEIRVLLDAGLAVETAETHRLAIAGDKCRSSFIVTNRSNTPLDVDLQVLSNGPGVGQDARSVKLGAGESRTVAVTIGTDPRQAQRLSQQVQLTAVARVPGDGRVGAAASTEFEIIPRVSGKRDYFDRLPAEAGFSAIGATGVPGYGQFKLAGAGTLDPEGLHRLDFSFRGPGRRIGRDLTYPFGLQPDEYRLSYASPDLNVLAGDGTYSLTRLTETGNYGRGLDVGAELGRWSVRGYAERVLLRTETASEQAFQLGWSPDGGTRFNLSYLSRRDPERPAAGRLLSLQSRLARKAFHLDFEYSTDVSGADGFRPAGSAFWIEGGLRTKRWNSEFDVIRAGAGYHGYFRDLNYASAEGSYAASDKWGVQASFRDQKTHTALGPYIQPFADATFQAGAYYRGIPRLSLSLDERVHDHRDLSGAAAYDYRDSTLRLGAFFYTGTFSLQNFVDLGRTFNRLTREAERLTEYTVSGNYLALGRISLAAYVHYRDQNESFTGEKFRRLDMNFSAGLHWGRFDLESFYRTAVLHDLFDQALSRQNFVDPAFLLSNCDTFGIDLKYRFKSGPAVGFRVQKVINPFWDGQPRRAIVSLFEFTVPVGVPVARKRTVGMLRGRIFEADGGQGVPGVIVRMNDLATVTGPKGDYVFNGLVPGSYVLTLEDRRTGSGRVAVEKLPLAVTVEGGRKLDLPIGLTAGASIGGRVAIYDSGNGTWGQTVRKDPGPRTDQVEAAPQLVERAPLAGAVVELRGEGDAFEQVTGADGRFLFEGLRPGAYTLRVLDDALPESHVFERDSFELVLKPGAREELGVRVVPVVRTLELIDGGEVKIIKKRNPGPRF